MPRVARAVAIGVPHHITQRGNRRQDVFFSDGDRLRYLGWLLDYSRRNDFAIIAYCLMPNHVHIVGVPHDETGLAKTLQVVHMRHSQAVNMEQGWTGHLWQGRFFSCALDDKHLWAAVRYVEQNPVRAGIASCAWEYRWSSAACHCGHCEDTMLAGAKEFAGPLDEWEETLGRPQEEDVVGRLRNNTVAGKPSGGDEFTARLAETLGRPLQRRSRGRPRLRDDAE